MYEIIEGILYEVIRYAVLLTEMVGVAVLIWSVVRSVITLLRRRDQKHLRLELAEGIALALEFKMGGELLRTVIVRQWDELLILGAVILLRSALAFLIQWEIRNEKKQESAELPKKD